MTKDKVINSLLNDLYIKLYEEDMFLDLKEYLSTHHTLYKPVALFAGCGLTITNMMKGLGLELFFRQPITQTDIVVKYQFE